MTGGNIESVLTGEYRSFDRREIITRVLRNACGTIREHDLAVEAILHRAAFLVDRVVQKRAVLLIRVNVLDISRRQSHYSELVSFKVGFGKVV